LPQRYFADFELVFYLPTGYCKYSKIIGHHHCEVDVSLSTVSQHSIKYSSSTVVSPLKHPIWKTPLQSQFLTLNRFLPTGIAVVSNVLHINEINRISFLWKKEAIFICQVKPSKYSLAVFNRYLQSIS